MGAASIFQLFLRPLTHSLGRLALGLFVSDRRCLEPLVELLTVQVFLFSLNSVTDLSDAVIYAALDIIDYESAGNMASLDLVVLLIPAAAR